MEAAGGVATSRTATGQKHGIPAEMVRRSSVDLYRSSPDSGVKNYSITAQGTILHLRAFG